VVEVPSIDEGIEILEPKPLKCLAQIKSKQQFLKRL
jgi:hypothetical protein